MAIVSELSSAPTASNAATLLAQLYGPVTAPQDEGESLPLTCLEIGSNNTGELSAILAALSWLLHSAPPHLPATICYDSKYAADSILGSFNGTRNETLIYFGRALYTQVSIQRSLTLQHVKGHSNNQWNDLADHLAKLGNQGLSHLSPPKEVNLSAQHRAPTLNIDNNISGTAHIHPSTPMAMDAPT